MKSHHRLILTAALALTAAMCAGVAMTPASQQDKPPAALPAAVAQDTPTPPGEHHKWLDQLVGNWTVESEMMMGPDTPPVKSTATDTVRSLDGRWIIGEMKGEMPAAMGGGKVTAIITLGYDAEKGKYQGTWIDSMHDLLWVYTGTLDATGKILTLEAEGPNMMDPADKSKMKYRDVIEIKSADHRTLTSSAFMDGKWVQFGVTNYRRAK
jgi:hypothetical protein